MTRPAGESSPRAPSPEAAGRRVYLTILFSDLSDSTQLGEAMEQEHYAEMLAELRRVCREIIPRHGGRIARIQGDGVLAFFGYPLAQEDDGRRATEAALELHAAVSRIAIDGSTFPTAPLTLHSGIHAGLVLISDGDVERGRFELLGNVPNIAARLSSLAERDDIVVSEETLGPQAAFFATTEPRLVNLKGRTPSLSVLRVLARAATPRSQFEARTSRGLPPIVGRDAEMRALRDHLRSAMAGTPQCVVLSGGAGVGKTRLTEELLLHAATGRCRVLRGYCESYLGAQPLQPFLQMLRTLLDGSHEPASNNAELAAALTQARALLLPSSPPATAGEAGAAEVLRRLFDALAADRPVLLVIDDWQWIDDASQQVLDAVLGLRRPVFVLLGKRGSPADPPPSRPMTTIELAPLGEAESAQATLRLLPGADPFLVAEIGRHAGGIPLFIEELCHSVAANGAERLLEVPQGGAAWLAALVESRVGRLPPEQAHIVRAAAVLGTVFPAWLLERITGHGESHPLVRALAEQDFIFPADRAGWLRFKHGLTRDVVYEAVSLHERRALHLRVAEALGAHTAAPPPEDAFELLAYHCAAGGLAQPAARYAELAGDKAMAASALDRARAQYSASLAALDRSGALSRDDQLRWCAVAQKLGMACVFDPLGLADGVAIFERCLTLARQSGDLAAVARAEYWLGYICYAKGMARAATLHCEASLDLALRIGDARLAAQVRATLGQVLLSACRYDAALTLFDVAIDSKRKQSTPGSRMAVGSAYTLACKGYLLGDRGQFADAHACFEEALHLIGDSVHQVASSVRHWVSVVCQWQGRWEEALRASEEATHIAEHVRSRQQLAMGRALSGWSRWVMTRQPESLQAVRDATSWIDARRGGLATSLNHGWLVEGAIAIGNTEEARRHAARLFVRARQHDRIGEALGCRALARAAAKVNDFARASHYIEQAFACAQARGSAHEHAATLLCAAQIQIDRGQAATAHQFLDEACAAFEAMQMVWHLERAGRLRERL